MVSVGRVSMSQVDSRRVEETLAGNGGNEQTLEMCPPGLAVRLAVIGFYLGIAAAIASAVHGLIASLK